MRFISKTVAQTFFAVTLCLLIYPQMNHADVLVEINNLRPEKIEFAGFSLDNKQEVDVEAYGFRAHRRHYGTAFTSAWILNSQTREVVWNLSEAEMERNRRSEASYQDKIELEGGIYEVYYATYPYFDYDGEYYYDDGFGSFMSHVFGAIFGDDEHDYNRMDFEKLFIRVEGKGKSLDKQAVFDRQESARNDAILSFTGLRGESLSEQLFKVEKTTDVRVYALGEARRDGEFDFGWIVNLETRDRIWELRYRHSEHAGGARKNRLSDEVVTLDPGTYKAIFVTDDSHHYRRWNSFPPYDPEFWGLTIFTENSDDSKNITMLDGDNWQKSDPIIDFTRVRDSDYRVQGFTVKKPLDLHVFALGEGDDGDMFDYGWIVNTKNREKVWQMKYRETDPAGGASKNRMFDGVIQIEPGNYMAYYVTDGSHAYHSWNMSPPFDERKWGMTISVVDENYEDGDIVEYKESEDESLIAKIVRVGDDAREREKFTIEKDGYVRVYAIGEGSSGDMYDYAYIEDSNTGQVVWEMTYRKTERAGGARKNRLFDDEIYLETGTYYVIYESDDSHSFEDWNETPPHDPVNYGITITHAD